MHETWGSNFLLQGRRPCISDLIQLEIKHSRIGDGFLFFCFTTTWVCWWALYLSQISSHQVLSLLYCKCILISLEKHNEVSSFVSFICPWRVERTINLVEIILYQQPFMKDLLKTSLRADVSKTIKNTSQRILDAFVDSVFQFVDQPLLPSQVYLRDSCLLYHLKFQLEHRIYTRKYNLVRKI